jgi:hypothetical protein
MVASAAIHTNPGTANHLLRKFIRDYLCKGELINRLCEEFHKPIDRRKNVRTRIAAQGAKSLLQTSGLSLSDAVDCSNHLDENGTQQGQLTRVWCGSVKKGAHAPHDVLVESRLEKLDGVQRALSVREQFFVFFCGRGRRILARGSQRASRISRGEMELVQGDQHRLSEIE